MTSRKKKAVGVGCTLVAQHAHQPNNRQTSAGLEAGLEAELEAGLEGHRERQREAARRGRGKEGEGEGESARERETVGRPFLIRRERTEG